MISALSSLFSRIHRPGLFVIFSATVLISASCMVEDKSKNTIESYNELYASINYKEKRCGHKPDMPLIIPDNPSEYGVRLCSLMIIREECPFHEYPVFCLQLYIDLHEIGK
jgi:hypothetical protein